MTEPAEVSFFYEAPAAIVLLGDDGTAKFFYADRAVLTADNRMVPTAPDGTCAACPHAVIDTAGALETAFFGTFDPEDEATLRAAVSALENFLILATQGTA